MSLDQMRPQDEFEKSFAKSETAEINGTQVEVVDVRPANPKDKIDVLLAGAWACTTSVYKPAIRELSREGRRVIGFNHPREGGEIRLTPEERELLKDYPEEQVRKALTIIGVLEHKKTIGIDILAHSEGAASAVIAVFLLVKRAEKTGKSAPVHNLLLCGPAGLIGKDNLFRLGYGFALQDSGIGPKAPSLKSGSEWGNDTLKERLVLGHRQSVTEAHREQARSMGGEMPEYEALEATEASTESAKAAQTEPPKYVTAKNISRAMKEIWGLSQIQIENLLRPIKAHGVGIVVMTGVDDPVFPIKRIQKIISGLKGPDENTRQAFPEDSKEWKGAWRKDLDNFTENIADGVLPVRGGHGDTFDPRFVAVSESVLSQLDARYESRKNKPIADTSVE